MPPEPEDRLPDDLTAGPLAGLAGIDAFLVVVAADGAVLAVGGRARAHGGDAAADVTGQMLIDGAWFDRLPDSRRRLRDALRRAVNGQVVRREIEMRTADGRDNYEFTFLPRLAPDGALRDIVVSGIPASARDKSAQESNLAFLRDLGDRCRELDDPARIMQITVRELGRHLRASRVSYADVEKDRFHIRQDFATGCDSTVGEYALASLGPTVCEAILAGRPLPVDNVAEDLAGDSGAELFDAIECRAFVCCPLVKFGRIVAFIAVQQTGVRAWTESEVALIRDVVERSYAAIERARVQEQLRRKERQFEDLFEYAPDALLIVNVEGDIVMVNRRAEELFGRSRQELQGGAVTAVLPGGIDVRAATDRLGGPRHDQPGGDEEQQGIRRDGERFPVELALNPLESEHGPVVAVSVRDNTERNLLEQQVQQSRRMETIGQLAGGVAHDFNNVLTVINATAEMLLDRPELDRAVRDDLATILRAGEQAAGVTRQLLALGRQQVMEPALVDLNTVLAELEPLVQRLVGEQVVVKLRLSSDPATVRVDRSQIEQVMFNLVLNARDAMPDGGTLIVETTHVQLDATLVKGRDALEAGPHVLLSVSDTGRGMDEATRRRIFEPFFTTKARGEGSGMGLSTAYGIVRQSGGDMDADSEPGKGTTIRLYLPRCVAAVQPGTGAAATATGGSETVLVVEDETEIRKVAEIMLERRGYRVLSAASGSEALEIAEREARIDLVISDVVMPGSNGPETVRQLRERLPGVKALFISGYAADLIERHGIDEGPRHFLAKPFTLAELSRAVRAALDD